MTRHCFITEVKEGNRQRHATGWREGDGQRAQGITTGQCPDQQRERSLEEQQRQLLPRRNVTAEAQCSTWGPIVGGDDWRHR